MLELPSLQISDNQAVVDGSHRGPKPGQGNMDDLRERFWAIYNIARSGGWEISFIKIKSRTLKPDADTESIDLEEMPYEYRLGNSYADYWAELLQRPLLAIGDIDRQCP